ncbi:hypothetical protein MRX96_022740 [Rhipicephalus microplus]
MNGQYKPSSTSSSSSAAGKNSRHPSQPPQSSSHHHHQSKGQLSRARPARGCNIEFQGKLFASFKCGLERSLNHEPPSGTI